MIMLRRICIIIAAGFAVAVCNPARSQDAPSTAGTTNSASSEGDELTELRAENATLKKEIADATHTIAQLQARLAKGSTAPGTADNQTSDSAAAAPETAAAPNSTNAAPSGPMRALPLDATNANVTVSTPEAATPNAGPSRTYTVVKGDSLWKIAHKMYPGDTKNGVDKIQDANKDALGTKPLKIGQVLIIPQ